MQFGSTTASVTPVKVFPVKIALEVALNNSLTAYDPSQLKGPWRIILSVNDEIVSCCWQLVDTDDVIWLVHVDSVAFMKFSMFRALISLSIILSSLVSTFPIFYH